MAARKKTTRKTTKRKATKPRKVSTGPGKPYYPPGPAKGPDPAEELLLQHSPALRYTQLGIRVDGRLINFKSYPFLVDLYDYPLTREPIDIVVIKGAQLGFTSWQILKVIDGAINVYQNQIGVYFPTEPDVQKFSKSRFARLMNQNPSLAKHVQETNAANMRQVGKVFVLFAGMKSRSAAKSTPNDLNVYDERDEMEDAMVELADRRLDGSEFKHRVSISTPTIPDFGVDLEYQSSDQRHWFLRCDSCGKHSCLELEFPACLQRRPDGKAERICVHCKAEIRPLTGQWVPMRKDPAIRRTGFYVSQLNSPTVSPTEILDEYERKQRDGEDLTEFYNSRLGRAHANIDDALEAPLLLALCSNYDRATRSVGPTFAGIDVGKVCHWVVGDKVTDDHLRILNWGTTSTLDDVADVLRRFGVHAYVVDQMAETHKVRSFCREFRGGFGCYYSQQIRNHVAWDQRENTVTVNRTESLDRSHAVITQARLDMPRADTEMREILIPQLCNLARIHQVNDKTGKPEARWVVRGSKRDHYRHALNYAVIASDRVSASAMTRMRARRENPGYRGDAGWMSA